MASVGKIRRLLQILEYLQSGRKYHSGQLSEFLGVWNADGSLNFHARVEGIREISWWILGYGDQAEVLAPPALRELIVAHVQRMAAVYQSSAAPPPKGAVTKRAVKKSTKRRSADPEKPKS